MCGIAGLLGVRGEAARTAHEVAQMTATLVHRGPDDAGFADGEGWAMGMRRLAVQDTSSAGHQPMRVRGLTLVFNGEVYNFPALRSELRNAGYRFRSGSDTEVVLYALEHWGLEALGRFNGMYALALVDESRRSALLARDRFGKKPLFLARLQRGVAFASELKAIAQVAADELSLSREALAQYFRFQYVPAPLCIYNEVQKLPAASYVEVDLDSGEVPEPVRYWSPPASPTPRSGDGSAVRPGDGSALRVPDGAGPRVHVGAADVLEAVRESVKRRLLADVPVGAFLSGGVDSSLVVACMCDAAADVRTFSIGFRDPDYDEAPHALAVARHLGTRHTSLCLEPANAIAIVPRLGDVYDEPFADSSAIPTIALARLAREHVTVALSGDGGDELFGGYARYKLARAVRVAGLLPGSLARPLRALPARGRLGGRVRLLAAMGEAGNSSEAYRELVAVWRAGELRRLMPDVRLDACPWEAAWPAAEVGTLEGMMRCDARTYLIDDILQKVDRATMAVSLEARNPLLDPDVVELAFASTDAARSAPGRKPLLREALKLRLPESLVERPKKGFGVPVGQWMRVELRPLVEDLVLARADAEYDVTAARRVCQAHLSGELDATPQVWSLLAFELWRQHWLQGGRATA